MRCGSRCDTGERWACRRGAQCRGDAGVARCMGHTAGAASGVAVRVWRREERNRAAQRDRPHAAARRPVERQRQSYGGDLTASKIGGSGERSALLSPNTCVVQPYGHRRAVRTLARLAPLQIAAVSNASLQSAPARSRSSRAIPARQPQSGVGFRGPSA